MGVYFDDFFDGGGFEEGGGYALFDAEEDAMGGGDLGVLLGTAKLFGWGFGERHTPMAVEPSLMASREYSTWKRRPSGEKVLVQQVSGDIEESVAIFILDAPICIGI